MKTYNEIKTSLTVTEWFIGENSLQIHYVYNGEEHTMSKTPEQAAELLKSIGLIEDHVGMDSGLAVIVRVDTATDDSTLQEISWSRFAWEGLDQSTATELAILEEDQKQMNKWASEILSIPDLIKEMI